MTEETRDAYFAAMRGAYRSGNQDGCVHAAEDKARRESLESLLRDSYNALIAAHASLSRDRESVNAEQIAKLSEVSSAICAKDDGEARPEWRIKVAAAFCNAWIAELRSLVEEAERYGNIEGCQTCLEFWGGNFLTRLEELYNAAKKLYEETGGDPLYMDANLRVGNTTQAKMPRDPPKHKQRKQSP